jgi:hypothetical protein
MPNIVGCGSGRLCFYPKDSMGEGGGGGRGGRGYVRVGTVSKKDDDVTFFCIERLLLLTPPHKY